MKDTHNKHNGIYFAVRLRGPLKKYIYLVFWKKRNHSPFKKNTRFLLTVSNPGSKQSCGFCCLPKRVSWRLQSCSSTRVWTLRLQWQHQTDYLQRPAAESTPVLAHCDPSATVGSCLCMSLLEGISLAFWRRFFERYFRWLGREKKRRKRKRQNQLWLRIHLLQRGHLFLTGLSVFVMVPLLSLIPLLSSSIRSLKVQFFTGGLIGSACPVKCDAAIPNLLLLLFY